jgi:hypothetical protein
MQGASVAELQDGLQLLLQLGLILGDNESARREFEGALKEERASQTFAAATASLVSAFQRQQRLQESGEVDARTAAALNDAISRKPDELQFLVRGQVHFAEGLPAVNYVLTVFARGLREPKPLGHASTDGEGRYEIHCSPEQFERARITGFVRVANASGTTLRESDVLFGPSAELTVDFDLGVGEPDRSEYERLRSTIEPRLEGISLSDLTEEQKGLLAAETGVPAERIAALIDSVKAEVEAAARLARGKAARSASSPARSASAAETARKEVSKGPSKANEPAIPAVAFYSWFRDRNQTTLDQLLQSSPGALAESLQRAVEAYIAPRSLLGKLDDIRSHLERLKAEAVLARPTQEVGTALKDLLQFVGRGGNGLTPDEASAFALLRAESLSGPELWRRASETLPESKFQAVQSLHAIDRIVGGDTPVLQAAVDRLRKMGGDGGLSLSNIAAMEADDWREIVEAGESELDNDVASEKARDLMRGVADLMPTDFLLTRAARAPKVSELTKRIDAVEAIRRQTGGNTKDGRLEELNAGELEAFSQIRRLARFYPGLELYGVLNGNETSGKKAEEITHRIGLIEQTYRLNPTVDFLTLDYTPDRDVAAIKFDGIANEDRPLVLRTLKAYQRIHDLAGNALVAQEVLEAGFSSAAAIVNVDPTTFAAATGLDLAEAAPIHAAAKERALDASLQFMAYRDYIHGRRIGGKQPRGDDQTVLYLRKLDGFEQMFGSQATCHCRHCRSVLSPAAYFVDLMHFIEKSVTVPVFGSAFSTHPLSLRARRPDLWELELSCDNTERLIPTLQVVSEILEKQILAERRNQNVRDAHKDLARAADSVRQPLILPLRRVELYLGHFERTRAEVARALGADGSTYARARLSLSVTEHDLIVADRSGKPQFLGRLFGAGLVKGLPAANEVQPILRLTGWTREELGQLLSASFVKGTAAIAIEPGKRSEESIQNDIERVTGLDRPVLDRQHRFARLWRKLPWTVAELDQALYHLGAGAAQQITDAHLQGIAFLLDLQTRFGLLLEQALILCGDFPPRPFGERRSLYDRLFNLEPFVSQDGDWSADPNENKPDPTKPFTHPAFAGGASAPDNRALQRLLAGLLVTDQELVELLSALGLTSGSPASVALTPANLALLYRHARLARLLKLSIVELLQLLGLCNAERCKIDPATCRRIRDAADLAALLKFYDNVQASGFSLDDLALITAAKVLKPDAYPDPKGLARAIAVDARKERSIEFDEAALVEVPGFTEESSHALMKANAAVVEPVADSTRWRLKSAVDIDQEALTLPAKLGIVDPNKENDTKEALRGFLRRYDSRQVVARGIAAKLRLPEPLAHALTQPPGSPLITLDADLRQELEPEPADDKAPKLEAIFEQVLSLTVLLRSTVWDADALKFLAGQPALFGLSGGSPLKLSTETAFKVAAYARFAGTRETEFTPEKAKPDPVAVREVLKQGLANSPKNWIASALRVPQSRIDALHPHLSWTNDSFADLDRLAASLELAGYLDVSGETLKLIVPLPSGASLEDEADKEHDDLAQAAEGLYGVIRAKYPDAKTFEEKVEAIEDRIRGLKRDGLVEYLIRSTNKGFTGPDDLYRMFLIDTQVEGCARTSRLVVAISSLQLYVHRILMNLEQEDPSRTANPLRVEPWRINVGEWTWRKNYRVWEANRKVFLHPENYLEPALRDDKTPLFEELESTLLQQEINEQSATDAYAKYLRSFVEVAGLKIAGAYHEPPITNGNAAVTTPDALHLLGVTSSDPPTYYYRRIENLRNFDPDAKALKSTPWRKLDVQIPVRTASPIPFLGSLYLFWSEINSQPQTSFVEGTMKVEGYLHTIQIKYSKLLADGKWSAPQLLLSPEHRTHTFEVRTVEPPRLEGAFWTRVYPNLGPASNGGRRPRIFLDGVGFYRHQEFHPYDPYYVQEFPPDAKSYLTGEYLALDNRTLSRGAKEGGVPHSNRYYQLAELLESTRSEAELITWSEQPKIQPVNGSKMDYLIEVGEDALLLQGNADNGEFLLRRLGTTVADELVVKLAFEGLDGILSTPFQESRAEAGPKIATVAPSVIDTTYDPEKAFKLPDGTPVDRPLDFAGLNGVYFREIFFQIPFLIADHLNSQQRFSAAQRWYHYVFDPTSPETGDDRMWRYREFRERKVLDAKAIREELKNKDALTAYREDPFNPHAIARLRTSAYQKAVVMKYIDNLLDWGDSLFAEFTMESVNEATMLYIMAADILGPRPADVGQCGEGDKPLTYADIAPSLAEDPQFLIELEHHAPNNGGIRFSTKADAIAAALAGHGAMVRRSRNRVPAGSNGADGPLVDSVAGPMLDRRGANALSRPFEWRETRQSYWTQAGGTDRRSIAPYGGVEMNAAPPASSTPDRGLAPTPVRVSPGPGTGGNNGLPPGGIKPEDYTIPDTNRLEIQPLERPPDRPFPQMQVLPFTPMQATDVARTSLVFCVPANEDLLAYWDRVETRLHYIRNCMDINGNRRQLALFAPEIDPRLLVRARAAGLSMEEVLAVTSGSAPPYRFAFLIEKARQYASTVQSLGAALLSALEKRDAEELSRLRAVHEQNLLTLRTQALKWEIEGADDTLCSLKRQKSAVEYRKAHYAGLIQTGLIEPEQTQQSARQIASAIREQEAMFGTMVGVLGLIPQVGAPTAMKYGGVELSGSAAGFALAVKSFADLLELESSSAGVQATFQRREEEWTQQRDLADKEVANIDKQIEAACIRVDIAKNSLDLHDKTIAQAEEIFALYRDKFSSFGLYTWLSTQLHRLYREAFNMAVAVAKMAEQAYRFERGEENTTFLASTHWDTAHSGQLAGERLLLDLQQMERRFIETNLRTLEIEQSFSLLQFDPDQLLKLRQTGECEFEVPELLFDLSYPGHYRRRIKAVRLTIPSVVGPYVSVGATLRLLSSEIRLSPDPKKGPEPVPLRHATSIAASTAQNDAGVFELSFRDERYMPFEGAGAVSKWRLTLPKNFPPFDYQTIGDVILRISYTADDDEGLREHVESFNGQLEGFIWKHLTSKGLRIMISLRHQLPDTWHKLVHSPVGTKVGFELTERNLPFLFTGLKRKGVGVEKGNAALLLCAEVAPDLELAVDGGASGRNWQNKWDGVYSAELANLEFLSQHEIVVKSSGSFGVANERVGRAIDPAKLSDILLRMDIKAAVKRPPG